MRFVLDASVAVAAARPKEPSHSEARALVARVLGGQDEIVVPAIFPIEVAAALARVGEPVRAIHAYVDALMGVVSEVATIGPQRARRIRDMAIESRLRAADAICVWLAAHESIPLCTLDKEMAERGAGFCQVVSL